MYRFFSEPPSDRNSSCAAEVFAAFWWLLHVRVVGSALGGSGRLPGQHRLRHLQGEQRQKAQVALARIERRREFMVRWPCGHSVIATQVFAVAFNLPACSARCWRTPTHELRFGWQTTLEVRAQGVAKAIEVVAAPWSWAPNAHPTPEQIVATRFAPGQSLATLPGESARAWWPFLATPWAATVSCSARRCCYLRCGGCVRTHWSR